MDTDEGPGGFIDHRGPGAPEVESHKVGDHEWSDWNNLPPGKHLLKSQRRPPIGCGSEVAGALVLAIIILVAMLAH